MSELVSNPAPETGVRQPEDGVADSSIQIPAIKTNELVGYERGKLLPLTSLSDKFLEKIGAYDLIKKKSDYRVYCTTSDTINAHSLSDCGSNFGERLIFQQQRWSCILPSGWSPYALHSSTIKRITRKVSNH